MPCTASSSVSTILRSYEAIGQTSNSALLQPHEQRLDSVSFEKLTSVAGSDPNHTPAQLRRPAPNSSYFNTASEHNTTHAPHPRPGQVHAQYHINHSSNYVHPRLRNLLPVGTAQEEVHLGGSSFDADESVEESFDEEMVPTGLDLSLGRLYGFPYCTGVPDAIKQRSKAVAETEEAEYRREKERKQKARLSGRMSSAFKEISLSWAQRGKR